MELHNTLWYLSVSNKGCQTVEFLLHVFTVGYKEWSILLWGNSAKVQEIFVSQNKAVSTAILPNPCNCKPFFIQ